jgi:two-component system cell cycle sensor histidine kinase/response regulator CckA
MVEHTPQMPHTTTQHAAPQSRSAELPDPTGALANVRGAETILVVDDQRALCTVVDRILAKQGYTVLIATSGAEALRLIEDQPRAPDLMLTDVVLGNSLDGPELADRVHALRPQMRVMFMSGYTHDVISLPELEKRGRAFVAKPFNAETLRRTVREVLDAP